MNRLAGSPSLYLRQHADNPVDWWPWGDAAFAEAARRDVPVLLSIGYAACHWCHVMAHECFEDDRIAQQVNALTVPVKVDREERPDVDALYMAATIAMQGHGGWPLTLFLTADGRPFYAGTYLPPVPRHGQPSLPQVLGAVADVWTTARSDVLAQADRLSEAVRAEATVLDRLAPTGSARTARATLRGVVAALATRFDESWGGFSDAPKFPHPAWVESCAALARCDGDANAATMATATLDAMARGGLFDHLAGGFARYSVDAQWHVPHFEKMLSDQALLARAYLRAAAWLGDERHVAVARRTLDFVLDEMRVDGGFASAIDADAGGAEGAHVVLRARDVRTTLEEAGLGSLADRTIARYELTDDGPVDGACVPRLAQGTGFEPLGDDDAARRALLARRARGPQPAVDDKVLLEWNAMLAAVLAEAAWRLGDDRYAAEATALVASLARTHRADGTWRRRSGDAAPIATSADLAWMLEAHVACFELDGDVAHLEHAAAVLEDLLDGHWDGERPSASDPDAGGGLFYSHRASDALLVRAKDLSDGAVPSGASIAAVASARLGQVASNELATLVAQRLVALLEPVLARSPDAVPTLVEAACVLGETLEVAVPGPPGDALAAVRAHLPPYGVTCFGTSDLELLAAREPGRVYVCRRSVCAAPLDDLDSVTRALDDEARWEGGD